LYEDVIFIPCTILEASSQYTPQVKGTLSIHSICIINLYLPYTIWYVLPRHDQRSIPEIAVDTHPTLDILHNVNTFTSYTDLIFGTQAFIELHGNAFWYIVKNKGGTITEIWPLDPTRVQVVKSEKTFIAGYIFTNEKGMKVTFE
jgi:hypothetical protein